MDVVIITGLSGAGKTSAVNALEDIGFFCVDNLPPSLMPRFAEMAIQINKYSNIAFVVDVRTGEFFSGFFDAVEDLKKLRVNVRILFLDASDAVLEKRYSATRRKHPLMTNETSDLLEAIRDERAMLRPILGMSDYRIDTSLLSVAQTKEQVVSLFLSDKHDSLYIRCMSFGYKFGVPTESDLVLDVRCLPNPFYVDALKDKTGLNKEVCDYVFASPNTHMLTEKFYSLVDFLLPLYKAEGKSQLVIAIGCTGGRHRSVAVAEDLCAHIKTLDFKCKTVHRDINKTV
ncbi:MAG: RNase adapter RapZ [Oscillospiraceae bacterium]|nr:RNase adapter RapZ [Oscillospiraceae bacterium]